GGSRRPLTGSVTALVERHDVIAGDEGRHHSIEPVGVSRAAGEKAERGAAGLAPPQRIQGQAVHGEGTTTSRLASEAGRIDHARHCTRETPRRGPSSTSPGGLLSAGRRGRRSFRKAETTFSVTCRDVWMASGLLSFSVVAHFSFWGTSSHQGIF